MCLPESEPRLKNIMTLRERTVGIIQKHKLTSDSDKATFDAAFSELSAVAGITEAYARNRIREALHRIARGLDPINVKRGGNHKNAGRKPKKITCAEILKDTILTITPLFISQERIMEALSTLPERERKVLTLRLEFFNGRIHTLQEIGDEMQVTREWVRQIQNRGIKYLVAALEKTALNTKNY